MLTTRHKTRVLSGRTAILRAVPRLQVLATAWGQEGAASYIDYFLTQPYTGGKEPHLLLFQQAEGTGGEEVLKGAVLVHEYRLLGLSTGVYVTEDLGGERNILGPPQARSTLALQAARYLLRERRARLAVLSLQDGSFYPPVAPHGSAHRWALRHRTLLRRMPLQGEYQATLATLGQHTRRNFRLYRRRALGAAPCSFVPDVRISQQDFAALNADCDYPVPLAVAHWRHQSVHTVTGGVLVGVRSGDGNWISMIGGRRYDGTFAIDWQMNHKAYAQISPATLMRGFLMEDEIARGTKCLLFQGGTPHSMHSAFEPEHVVDLVASPGSLPATLLPRLAHKVRRSDNFLLQTLSDPTLAWHAHLESQALAR